MKKNKSILLMRMKFRTWITDKRIWALLLYQMIGAYFVTSPVSEFTTSIGYRISPYLYVFVASNYSMILWIMSGAILLFMDAPFMNNLTYNQIIRSGRSSWNRGQVLYILLASTIYILGYVLFIYLFLITKTTFINDWGRVMHTLSKTYAGGALVVIDGYIMRQFNPITAMSLSIIISILQCTFVGLIIYNISLHFRTNKIGLLVSGIIRLFRILCMEYGNGI